MILCLAVLVQYRLVKDGWTDRQTHDDSIYRASIALRGKKLNDQRCQLLPESTVAIYWVMEHLQTAMTDRTRSNADLILCCQLVYSTVIGNRLHFVKVSATKNSLTRNYSF